MLANASLQNNQPNHINKSKYKQFRIDVPLLQLIVRWGQVSMYAPLSRYAASE
uniref:Uncharacterized protein n=1 Tax=Picea glauca TaxID=3330 RepID=A0A124GN49_PICGL|nr:hypothetical protein ABT39_MTgene5894 [Picea glauca]QHR92081.1 hypothetical protein Q903MT_gene6117 [Picea sitchensis]